MINIDTLNKKYGIPGIVTIHAGENGLAWVEISNDHASASIALQGAHLLSWTPRRQEPVIWLSPDATFARGKSVRGGIPVCWPWFGAHDKRSDFPAHGFARTVDWELTGSAQLPEGTTLLHFRLLQNEYTAQFWPHACELDLELTIGATLDISLVTRNMDTSAFVITQALHTYFQVSDVTRTSIDGLDGCAYLDKVENFARKQQSGPVVVAGEVDRIYLNTGADCVIADPGYGRCIRISKQGSQSTVVWNPWKDGCDRMGDLGKDGYLNMICVESANAADDKVSIAPGEEHCLSVSYKVESIS